jgi:hypothetical protein
METKRHSVNLKQYRKVNGKWQSVPVARAAKSAPDPRLVVIDGEPTSWCPEYGEAGEQV